MRNEILPGGKLRQRETVKKVTRGRGEDDLVAGTDRHRLIGQRHPIGREEGRIGLKEKTVG